MSPTRLYRWLCAGALAVSYVGHTPEAKAHNGASELPRQYILLLVPVVGDFSFAVYDLVAVGEEHMPTGWLVAQTAWTAPQALLANAIPFFKDVPGLGLRIWVSQLTAFSTYGLAAPSEVGPGTYGLSWAIGANTAISTNALGLALGSEFASGEVAITEIVASVPQIGFAAYALAAPEDIPKQRGAVLALGGWSAGILAHGVASLVFYRPKAQEPKERGMQISPSLIASDLGMASGLSARGTF